MNILIIENLVQARNIINDSEKYKKYKLVALTPNIFVELEKNNFDVSPCSDFISNQSHLDISIGSKDIYEKIEGFLKKNKTFKTISARTTFQFYIKFFLNHILMSITIIENIKKRYPNCRIKSFKQYNQIFIDIKKAPVLVDQDLFIYDLLENDCDVEIIVKNKKNKILSKIINSINYMSVKIIKTKKIILTSFMNNNMTLYLNHLNKLGKPFDICRLRLADKSLFKEFIYAIYSFVMVLFGNKIKYKNLRMLPFITVVPEIEVDDIKNTLDDFSKEDIFSYKSCDFYKSLYKKLYHLFWHSYFIDNSYDITSKYLQELNDIKLLSLASLGYASTLGEVCKNNNIESVLISHGSHTNQLSSSAQNEHELLAVGQINSSVYDEIVVQSPYAYEFIKDKGKKITLSKPIMWGNSFDNYEVINKKNNQFILLHASTPKVFMRPIIYETSFEYIDNIVSVYNTIKDKDNIKLLVRFRPDQNISLDTIEYLLPKSEKISIVTDSTFQYYLKLSDVLISYSSTTIEEAMLLNKPTILYGNKGLYKHIQDANNFADKYGIPMFFLKNERELESIIDLLQNSTTNNHIEYKTYDKLDIYSII